MPVTAEIVVAIIAALGAATASWVANRSQRKSVQSLDKQINQRDASKPTVSSQIDRVVDVVDRIEGRLDRIESRQVRIEGRVHQLEHGEERGPVFVHNSEELRA